MRELVQERVLARELEEVQAREREVARALPSSWAEGSA